MPTRWQSGCTDELQLDREQRRTVAKIDPGSQLVRLLVILVPRPILALQGLGSWPLDRSIAMRRINWLADPTSRWDLLEV